MDGWSRILMSKDSGEEYTLRFTHEGKFRSCSCPHWQYRLRTSSVQCKHVKQLKEHDEAQDFMQRKILAYCEKNWLLDFHADLVGPIKPDDEEMLIAN